jgi:geranyl-CoA carboxylase alpha subunit
VFLPQSGRMLRWRMPPDLRVEHALRSEDEIPPFYDSMIAKLIAWGSSREEARRKLQQGLQSAVALGVRTNQQFLARCLAHPVFVAGGATTDFIGKHIEDLLSRDEGDAGLRAAIAGFLLFVTACEAPHHDSRGMLAPTLPIPMRLDLDGVMVRLTLVRERTGGYLARIEQSEYRLDLVSIEGDTVRLRVDGVLERAVFCRDGARLWVRFRADTFFVQDRTREAVSAPVTKHDGAVRASMNGRVALVLVEVGQRVEVGQPLVTLEAMKMEHVHTAPVAGIVSALAVSEGEQIEANRVLAEISAG